MPNIKNTGFQSGLNYDLKNKKQLIIEQERIRVLGDSLMLFYDKLMESYQLFHPQSDEAEESEPQVVSHEEVEELVREYAETKPLGF